jgi:hypothetical protein
MITRLLYANHDIIFIKITSNVSNEILNICLCKMFNYLNTINYRYGVLVLIVV